MSNYDRLMVSWRRRVRKVREERDLQREMRGELDPYRRLIVVTGMARSGTSVVAAYLGSHPDVKPVIGGGCWQVVESDLIRPEMGEPDWDTIDDLLREHYPHRLLLKQPWLLTRRTIMRAVRPAKIVICLRDRTTLFGSWSGSERVDDRCKFYPDVVYNENMAHLPSLLAAGASWVYQDQLDKAMSVRIGKYLGLDPVGFDAGILAKRWQECLEKPWLDAHAVRRERRRG